LTPPIGGLRRNPISLNAMLDFYIRSVVAD